MKGKGISVREKSKNIACPITSLGDSKETLKLDWPLVCPELTQITRYLSLLLNIH